MWLNATETVYNIFQFCELVLLGICSLDGGASKADLLQLRIRFFAPEAVADQFCFFGFHSLSNCSASDR